MHPHGTLSGAARAVLEHLFGKYGHSITLQRANVPGVVLNYTEFRQICDDISDARVYGGIHFRFDQEAGARQGREVGHYVLDNYLRTPSEVAETDEPGIHCYPDVVQCGAIAIDACARA
jgi:hypothetical protein